MKELILLSTMLMSSAFAADFKDLESIERNAFGKVIEMKRVNLLHKVAGHYNVPESDKYESKLYMYATCAKENENNLCTSFNIYKTFTDSSDRVKNTTLVGEVNDSIISDENVKDAFCNSWTYRQDRKEYFFCLDDKSVNHKIIKVFKSMFKSNHFLDYKKSKDISRIENMSRFMVSLSESFAPKKKRRDIKNGKVYYRYLLERGDHTLSSLKSLSNDEFGKLINENNFSSMNYYLSYADMNFKRFADDLKKNDIEASNSSIIMLSRVMYDFESNHYFEADVKNYIELLKVSARQHGLSFEEVLTFHARGKYTGSGYDKYDIEALHTSLVKGVENRNYFYLVRKWNREIEALKE